MVEIATIQLVTFLVFTTFVTIKKGTLPSVSHSFYALEKWGWVFTPTIWVVGFLQCLHAHLSGFFFFSGVGLCLLATANAFMSERMTYRVHVVGTIIAILAPFLAFLEYFDPIVLLLLFIVPPTGIFILRKVDYIWWIEHYYLILIYILLISIQK